MFIRNFAHRANPLTMLTRKNQPFVFGPEQISAQDDLRQALIESPALRPIDYNSTSSVILAVDTSQIAILSMFHRQSSEAVLRSIWFHHPQQSRIALLAAEVGVIWPLPIAPRIKVIPDRCPKSSHRSRRTLY